MTEKIVWETYSLGIQQRQPRMQGDVVCLRPGEFHSSLAEWPERARLICAAPDLLAACELVIAWEDDDEPLNFTADVYPALRAAIAKATGAGELVGLPDEPELYSEPEPIDTPDCPCCAETPVEQGPVLSGGGPALKEWWVSADQGEVLRLRAERIEEYDGGLGLYVGDDRVGLVAAGRWIAYWQDGTASSFGG